MSMLEVKDLRVRLGREDIVKGASFALNEGDWLMLAGPNGAGKSTLVRAISQGAPYTGRVLVGGEDARKMPPTRLSKKLGVLAQRNAVGYAFTVEEVVALGRYAHAGGPFASPGDDDRACVERALSMTGLWEKRGQSVLTLSGGETQRVFLAQVFAQNPGVLLLDEPTNHLDLPYQKQVFELIREWLKTPGRAALCVVHDLSLARAYGTRALLMAGGEVLAEGSVESAFSPERLNRVYGMDVRAWMRALLSQW